MRIPASAALLEIRKASASVCFVRGTTAYCLNVSLAGTPKDKPTASQSPLWSQGRALAGTGNSESGNTMVHRKASLCPSLRAWRVPARNTLDSWLKDASMSPAGLAIAETLRPKAKLARA